MYDISIPGLDLFFRQDTYLYALLYKNRFLIVQNKKWERKTNWSKISGFLKHWLMFPYNHLEIIWSTPVYLKVFINAWNWKELTFQPFI